MFPPDALNLAESLELDSWRAMRRMDPHGKLGRGREMTVIGAGITWIENRRREEEKEY